MLNLILLRLWRERRLMLMLLFSMALVTGFLALGPLYVQAVAGADFDQRIANASSLTFSLSLRDTQPFSADVPQRARDHLAHFATADRSYVSAPGFRLCGISIAPVTTPDQDPATNATHCYRPYGYQRFDDVLTLVDGRFPDLLPDASANDEIQAEALVSQITVDETELEIGSRIQLPVGDGEVTVEIVGSFASALAPDAAFFAPQTVFSPYLTPLGNADVRVDLSFIVPYAAYQTWYAPSVADSGYIVQLDLDRAQLSATTIDDIEQRIAAARADVTLEQPSAVLNSRLFDLIDAFRAGIATAQQPITLMSFMVLVLMLYNIISTAGLILEQQAEEWAMIASRGASALQLTVIQFVTVALLGLIAALAGPFVAYGILAILSVVGPQAAILDLGSLGGINALSISLSIIAAVIIVVVLTIPGWTAANNSLLNLKSGLSRPPERPVWARYYLDILLLGLGIAFLVRLYTLATGDSLLELLRNPASLIAALSASGVGGDFGDVFNLAGPALILVGASLLWMRLFPIIMRSVGRIVAAGNGLTTRLAFWNVERDPAHYAQLVLLLIGTLSLGTASLALSHTREQGAWAAAYAETGADVALQIDSDAYDPDYDYGTLPDVQSAIPLLIVPMGNERDGAFIGLDPADFPAEQRAALAPLQATPTLDVGGLPLPPDAVALRLDILSEAISEPEIAGTVDMMPALAIQDGAGLTTLVPLISPEATRPNIWITYTAILDPALRPPLRMMALHLNSRHSATDEFVHGVYLDRLVAVDASGTEMPLINFDADTYDNWQWDRTSRFNQILSSTAFTITDARSTEGDHSLRVRYRMETNGASPRPAIMTYRNLNVPPLPAIISQPLARTLGSRSVYRRDLAAGDEVTSRFTVPLDDVASMLVEPTLSIVGVVDGFVGYADTAPLVIADLNLLRYRFNTMDNFAQAFGLRPTYDINTLRIDLAERQPSAAFDAAVRQTPGFQSVTYAWTRYAEIQRDPLSNALTGVLFAGFWVSLALSLLDFGFYMAVTIRRRALTFATLQALGWREQNLLNLLLIEQIAFLIPALLIGMLFGVILAALILPFLGLVGALGLRLPLLAILALLAALVASFALILRVAAIMLRRLNLNQVMRFGE